LLGERSGGFKIAMNALNVGRIKLAAAVLDANRRAITGSVQYAVERKQFGKSIASFGAIQHKLAEMVARTWVSESAIYRAGQDIEDAIARLEASGMDPQEAKLKGVEEYAIECCILKVHASEVSTYVVDEGVQIFGGMGYSEDTPMESALRDVRITRIYEGTNEINRMHAVAMLLKKALKGELDLMTPAMAVANDLMGIPSFDTPDYSVFMAEELEMVAKMKKAILMVAGKAVEKYGLNLEEEQEVIMQVADMLLEVYMAESAVLRASKIHQNSGPDAAALPAAMTRLYLHQAVEKLGQAGREAINAFAEGDELRILHMGLRRFTKWQNPVNAKELRRTIAAYTIEHGKYPF
jgi:alkylation response protein AidB-like acyl-CoA dehydrogenase